jgi:hypothetical protein
MCVALLGLFVALGGTTWAAVSLPARSVGTAQLKPDAVTGAKVKNHSLTGADVNSGSLGMVPSALRASTATLAANALKADVADRAAVADSAGVAYSTHFETGITLPGSAPGVPSPPVTVASLSVPAGSYVIIAKGQVDTFSNSGIVGCDLVAGGDKDSSFVQGAGSFHMSQIIANSLVHQFITAGVVRLNCSAGLDPGSLSQVRLTATTIGSLTNTP